MPSTLCEFQSLFFELRDGPAEGWGAELFQPWLDAHPHVLPELHELGRPDSRRVRIPGQGDHDTALEGLYALSQVVDVLVSPFQPDKPDPELLDWTNGTPWWQGTIPNTSAWPAFCAAIGAAPLAEPAFHPFFHEIVSVQASGDADEPPSIIEEYWPGAVAGSLLLARAGVAIRAGAHHLDSEVASRSALYWAWWRRNRCGIRTDLGADQWPYNDTFVEQARTRRGRR